MTTSSGPRLRASDTEREQVATILRAAMSEGRLDLATGEERLAAVYAATFRDELGPLTADLPDGGRRALAETPEAKAQLRRFVRSRAAVVAAVALFVGALWVASDHHFFPVVPIIVLLFFLHAGRWRHHRRWSYHRAYDRGYDGGYGGGYVRRRDDS
jgi:uncharacterized protein DUF1707